MHIYFLSNSPVCYIGRQRSTSLSFDAISSWLPFRRRDGRQIETCSTLILLLFFSPERARFCSRCLLDSIQRSQAVAWCVVRFRHGSVCEDIRLGVAHTLVANEQCRRAAAVPLASDAAHALTLNKRTHTPLWSRTQAPAVSLPLKIARRLLRGCSRHFFFSLEHIVRLKGWRACRGETKKGRPHRSCAPIVRCGPPRCIGGGPNSLSACRHQKEIRNASRAVARSRAPLGASAHARHAIAPTPRAALACRALSLLSEAPGKSPPPRTSGHSRKNGVILAAFEDVPEGFFPNPAWA